MDQRATESKAVWKQAHEFMAPTVNDLERAISLFEKAIEIDNRNVLACSNLALIYASKLDDLERAEYYCMKGYAVTDIPPEITKPALGVDDIRAETDDNLNRIMMLIRLKQGRHNEAQDYLAKMAVFFDKYGKGWYRKGQEYWNDYQQRDENQGTASSSTSKSGCLASIVLFLALLILIVILNQ